MTIIVIEPNHKRTKAAGEGGRHHHNTHTHTESVRSHRAGWGGVGERESAREKGRRAGGREAGKEWGGGNFTGCWQHHCFSDTCEKNLAVVRCRVPNRRPR